METVKFEKILKSWMEEKIYLQYYVHKQMSRAVVYGTVSEKAPEVMFLEWIKHKQFDRFIASNKKYNYLNWKQFH